MFTLIPIFGVLSFLAAYGWMGAGATDSVPDPRSRFALSAIWALAVSGTLLLVAPDLLSIGSNLTTTNLTLYWLSANGLIVAVARRQITRGATQLSQSLGAALSAWSNRTAADRRGATLSAFTGLVLGGGTLAQWVLYPISDGDSIEFHMQRVFFWIQNQTTAHFPTSGPQALSTYPFTHFVTTQMVMLSGGSYFLATAVSWFAYIAAALLTGAVVRKLGAGSAAVRATFLIALSAPGALLQSVTGMHDLTAAMYALATIYVVLDLVREPDRDGRVARVALLGLLVGLTLNAKITGAVVISPFLLWLAIAQWRRWGYRATLLSIAVVFTIMGVLSLGMMHRNLSFETGDPLGLAIPGNAHIPVIDKSPQQLWVNLVRNLGNEVAMPAVSLNSFSERTLTRIAEVNDVSINDPTNMERPDVFRLHPLANLHETFSASPITLFAVVVSSLLIWISVFLHRGNGEHDCMQRTFLYMLSAWFGILFLGTTIMWHPFTARTLTTPLLVSVPTIGLAYLLLQGGAKFKRLGRLVLTGIVTAAVLFGMFTMAFSRTHPLLSDQILGLPKPYAVGFWDADRDELRYLTNSPWYEDMVVQLEDTVAELTPQRVTITGTAPQGVPFHIFSSLPTGTEVELHGPLIKPHTRRFGSAGTPELSDLIVALGTRPPALEMTFGGTEFRSVRSGSVDYPDYYELSRLYWALLVPSK